MKASFVLRFKNKDEWFVTVTREFNCHLDDEAAVRKELMREEISKRWPKAKGFFQDARRLDV